MAGETSEAPPTPGRWGVTGRLTLVMRDFSGGGAEKIMVNLATGLLDRGHDVELVVIEKTGPYLDLAPSNLPIVELGGRRVSTSVPALAHHLKQRRPDAVLSSLVHMNVATVLARALGRVETRLVVRQEAHLHGNPSPDASMGTRLAYRLVPWAYRRADHVVGVSRGVVNEVRERTGLGPERISTVYNPVLSEESVRRLTTLQPTPHPWLEPGAPPVVIAMGRLVPQKDYPTLLEGFARLRISRPLRLIILGEGPLRKDLTRQAVELGIGDEVHFAGFVEDPLSWMKQARLFAHTARWEGFGNVLVEALACGLPVVATDCPSGPREILDDGRYGRLVGVGDIDGLVEAIRKTLKETPDQEDLRDRAREFTVEAILPAYEALFGLSDADGSE